MGAFDVRDLIKADSAGHTPMGGESGNTRTFHPLAERIAAMPVKQTLSPVLIEGLVRLADVLVILGVGGLIFALYVAGVVDYTLPYQVTVPLVAAGALAAFQALHLYHVGALRNFISMAIRVIAGWTVLFLLALAGFFFLKIGDQVSRVWLAGFYIVGLALLLALSVVLLFV